jgi:hypothetical protein
MSIFNVLFGVLCLFNSSFLISKNGIGDVAFNKKVNEYSKKNYFKIEKKFYTDEAGDSTYYVTLYMTKNYFISIEAGPVSKKAISMTTNSPDYCTADSIRVGSTFEQLVRKYDGLMFLDGEGGELSAYLKKEHVLFQMPDLSFKNGFNFQNTKKKLEKSALLKNVKNMKVAVKYIKVVDYDLP